MENKRDYFAGLALQALIAKFPLMDKEGEFGQNVTEEQQQEIKKELTKSAWAYADWMILTEPTYKMLPQE